MNKQFLILGLGNFGDRYRANRHNAGSQFLEYWARSENLDWVETPDYFLARQPIAGGEFIFMRLKTLMNLSGIILKKALQQLQMQPNRILICADNLDLKVGKITFRGRLPQNKHNGLINVQMQFMNQTFLTLLFGIDRKKPTRDWVLSNFNSNEKKKIETQFKLCKNVLIASSKSLFASPIPKIIDNFNQNKTRLAQKNRLPSSLVVVGAQWGDEGKGKIVDYLADEKYPLVCRFSGGNNAGHTIQVGLKKYKFSLLPVGGLRPGKTIIIGTGCLVNLSILIQEWTMMQKIQPDLKLKISQNAHLIMPYHRQQDEIEEAQRKDKIGTTKQGIGPCMQDKVARCGFRVGDLNFPQIFTKRLKDVTNDKNLIWTKIYDQKPLDYKKIAKNLLLEFSQIKNYVTDVHQFFLQHQDKNVLFEGAQGTLLDLNFGSYPFVTSTPTTSEAFSLGFEHGLDLKTVRLGVFKAYVTRVGTGPLPTLVSPKVATKITSLGHEKGVVTQRLRKVGWFDAVMGKYACRVNQFRQIALTCLDALTGIAELKIAVAYHVNDQKIVAPAFLPVDQKNLKIEYLKMPGWTKTISHIRKFTDLPPNAQAYVKKIENLLEVKITLISVGPEREEVIRLS